jgi:FixJ family two-component response regulator
VASPISYPKATDPNASDPNPSDPSLGPREDVLIVDDNQSDTKALAVLFRGAGFNAVTFNRGLEALAHPSMPAAAVIDIHLTDFSGLILAQMLRERFGPHVPIVIVSGDTSMETINSLAHVGATHFFSKPVNGTALVARVKELIDGGMKMRG